jgi:glycosyltransferase involved in cell wall biosynthesis
MITRASFVVTVSNFGKQRIIEEFKLPEDKIQVTHIPPPAPIQLDDGTAADLVDKQGIIKKYLLYLGTIEPRKNVISLLDAYTKLPKEVRDQYSLALVGKVDWKFAEIQDKIKQLQSSGYDIIYLGYVDDQTRAALYHQATLFVFPPFYEGFGMPILEAMSYGTPCAISDIPVFSEVAGQAAAYFDPRNTDNMAEVIGRELAQPSFTPQQCLDHVASFTWDDICSQLHDRIVQAVNGVNK